MKDYVTICLLHIAQASDSFYSVSSKRSYLLHDTGDKNEFSERVKKSSTRYLLTFNQNIIQENLNT